MKPPSPVATEAASPARLLPAGEAVSEALVGPAEPLWDIDAHLAPAHLRLVMIAERSVHWPTSALRRHISGTALGGTPGRIAGHTPRRD